MAAAWLAWCLGLAWGCGCGTALAGLPRLAAAVLAVLAGAAGALGLLGGRSRAWPGAGWPAGLRLHWLPDGSWWLEVGGRRHYVQMSRPVVLGPLLWLRWVSPDHSGWACLEQGRIEPVAWRRLKARMKLQQSTLPGGRP